MNMPRLRLMPVLAKMVVLVIALILAGCGSNGKSEPTATTAPTGSSTATEAVAQSSPTVAPATSLATATAGSAGEATAEATPAKTVEATGAGVVGAASPAASPQAATAMSTPQVAATAMAATSSASATPQASPETGGGTVVSNLGCWSEQPSWDAGYPQWASAPEMKIDPTKQYTATIVTNRGTIVADLYGDQAPKTVNNFICLATNGYYDGVTFHRVINDFMIQTGDPTGTGRGGPGYQFQDELPGDDLNYDRGVLAMANAGPNTNGSQFFINQGNNSGRLGKSYTIFGKVTEGMDVVDKIAKMPVSANTQGEQSVPAATVTILSITIEEK